MWPDCVPQNLLCVLGKLSLIDPCICQ